MSEHQVQVVVTSDALKRSWAWLLGLGVLFILFGTIGLSMVVGLTVGSMFFLGLILMIAGVSQLVDVFQSKHWRGSLTHGLVAVLYMVGGCVVLYHPLWASSLLTLAIAGVFIIIGVVRLMMVSMLRDHKGFSWLLLAGIAAIVLGVLILLQWPYSGLWFIGLFIAIELIISGWTYVLLAFAIRDI